MKSLLLPALAALALMGASPGVAAHSWGHGDRHHEPPRHGHYKPRHHGHYKPKHHGHHGPAHYAPVVVVPAPRYRDHRHYRDDYRHRHHHGCGHGYRDTARYGFAFGTTPYGSWVDIRVGY